MRLLRRATEATIPATSLTTSLNALLTMSVSFGILQILISVEMRLLGRIMVLEKLASVFSPE